jgi:hypothetical protein
MQITMPKKNTNQAVSYDRRKSPRYKARAVVYAMLFPHYERLGKIIDVSESGLAFTYYANQPMPVISNKLNVLTPNGDLYIGVLPVTVVSDVERTNSMAISGTIRRISVKFGDLSWHKKRQIEELIQKYTFFNETDFNMEHVTQH